MPTVAIVGRPNVGKSSLLNALVGKRISIVQDMPGVTRDRVNMPLNVDGRWVDLVDTGGYGFIDPDALTEHIAHQIELAMTRADLVLFIVDCEAGLTTADQTIATLLRTKGIKTLLVANKVDGTTADAALGDFARLGFGTPVGVSALNNRNIDQLVYAIKKNVDWANAPTEIPPPTHACGDRRQAERRQEHARQRHRRAVRRGPTERVIVSEVPGTTRDSVDVRFEKDGKALVVIDTAGVRKKRHMVTNDIEFYSFHRAERSIRRADVVLLLIDGDRDRSASRTKSWPSTSLHSSSRSSWSCNKWDLAREKVRESRKSAKDQGIDDADLMQEFKTYLDAELKHVDYAPLAFVTAKDGRNIQAVVDLAQHLFNQASERVSTSKLNQAVRQILEERRPPTPTGRRARVYYATQADVAPPTIVLFVNKPIFITEMYQRYMINRLRELLPYAEVPIKLVIRGKDARTVQPGEAVDEHLTPDVDAHPQARPRPKAKPKVKTAGKSKRTTGAGTRKTRSNRK